MCTLGVLQRATVSACPGREPGVRQAALLRSSAKLSSGYAGVCTEFHVVLGPKLESQYSEVMGMEGTRGEGGGWPCDDWRGPCASPSTLSRARFLAAGIALSRGLWGAWREPVLFQILKLI